MKRWNWRTSLKISENRTWSIYFADRVAKGEGGGFHTIEAFGYDQNKQTKILIISAWKRGGSGESCSIQLPERRL